MGCLRSVNFSVIINGRPRGHFGASRGLRQGDPLSPFLFILVGDVLSRMVTKACDKGVVKGFEVGNKKVKLSHLQFADDSIFFLEKNDQNLDNLLEILKVFSMISGLKINLEKSTIAAINMKLVEVEKLATKVGCKVEKWPMKYIGLPLGGNLGSSVFWTPVVEKIMKRLDGWYKGLLSKGGRLTLIQSVLGSIPIFYMSLFKIPTKVAAFIEKLMRDYFWEGNGEGRKLQLVKWSEVSKPKSDGGLGIGNIIARNKALLGKWIWRSFNEPNSFWLQIILSRHGSDMNGLIPRCGKKSTLKAPWKSITNVWNDFIKNTRLEIGRGDKIKFWEDVWFGS